MPAMHGSTRSLKFPEHRAFSWASRLEHVPPDVTAQIFWLKNRKPTEWRDVQQLEHALGKYVISDRPMTEEEWIMERSAQVIDVTPEKPDATRNTVALSD